MARWDRLSLFPYFGGKARFCKQIAELLDYDHTDTYIEPFGGGASVLLNKPTHRSEIYSDVSRGLVALFDFLSNPDKASVLIDCLYETEYSKDCFLSCLQYRNSVEDNYLQSLKDEALKRLEKLEKKVTNILKKTDWYKEWIVRSEDDKIQFIGDLINKQISQRDDIKQLYLYLNDPKTQILLRSESFDLNENTGIIPPVDELKLAVSTYVVYAMSHYGIGHTFSNMRFDSSEAYYRQIDKLYDVAERLKGVHVGGAVGALSYLLESSYLNDERAMFYLDAPYLSADQEQKNLGYCYKGQMELGDHCLLLKTITQSKAKFLISNYDNPIYREYLADWTKVVIDTTTSIGGKQNNKRTECIWYNY